MGRALPIFLDIAPLRAIFAGRLRRYRNEPLRARMAVIGHAFTAGYRAALAEDDLGVLGRRLRDMDREVQGFAAEGIGLGLALRDMLSLRRADRFFRFLEGPGSAQVYMLHVGAGWVLAFPLARSRRWVRRLDPLYQGMAFDGYGFYRAFFFRRTLDRQHVPGWMAPADRRSFDVGIGRRLWFLDAGLDTVLERIRAFPPGRQGDLWTGLGEACAFGGGRGRAAAESLLEAAGPFAASFAQGIAFSAEVRVRGGNLTPETEAVCQAVWGAPADEVATVTRRAAGGLAIEEAPLETWRRRLQERYAARQPLPPAGAPPAAP